ncbi:MAG: hypothetical protein R6U84_04905 [Candidatus Cloacimonadales bacterium]
MKCKGMVKDSTKNGRTIERKCNNPLPEDAIYCDKCGLATSALSTDLSAKQNWQALRTSFVKLRGGFYKFNIFYLLVIFLPIVLTIVFQAELADALNIDQHLFINLALLLLVPLTLIPFAFEAENFAAAFTIRNYFSKLKHYPAFFLFTLISILYFLLLKILCTGYLINLTVDPILHAVRQILVLYWITIMFPAPLVMMRQKVGAFSAIVLCYQASAETRWQQFFTILYVALANLLGALVFGLGLLRSISFSYLLIERYYRKMTDYNLFKK